MAYPVNLRSHKRSPRIRVKNSAGTLVSLSPSVDTTVDLDDSAVQQQLGHHSAIGQWFVVGSGGAQDVLAPRATGNVATDTANLQAAINATPAGGTLWLDGHYMVNAALTCATTIALKGRQKVTYTGLGALPSGPNALSQVVGTIIEQTAVGLDGLAVTMAGQAFHAADLVIAFSSGLASTGHGINCAPASNVVGVYGGSLTGVYVFGHDGNHYGLVRNNSLEFTTTDFRWSGGGGILDICQTGAINYGNTLDLHPYGVLAKSGTAHGFAKSSPVGGTQPVSGGMLNLMTMVRPQCNIAGTAANTAQKPYSDSVGAGFPWFVTVIGADFESSGYTNPGPDYGPGTERLGAYYSTVDGLNTALGYKALAATGQNASTQQKSVAVGFNALAALSTATSNVAVGYFALSLMSTGSGLNTAVGYQALKALTSGNSNTAVGANALAANQTGGANTAVGLNALAATTTSNNTAVGKSALDAVVGGGQHVALGVGAGQTTIVSANYGTFIGYLSGSTGDFSGVTAIGNIAKGNANNTTALGKGATAGAAGAVAIGIDSAGTGATTATQDEIALGSALHRTKIAGRLNVAQRTPATSADAQGTTADITADDNFIYVKASTGWKRATLATF